MRLRMIGLGRMGGNMARRLVRRGHECVVFDSSAPNVNDFSARLLSAMRYQFGGHREHKVDELAGSPS
jgi:6-phosphogluconate dehydrogenase (decarboxylating)